MSFTDRFNEYFSGVPPLNLVLGTTFALISAERALHAWRHRSDLVKFAASLAYKAAQSAPGSAEMMEKIKHEALESVIEELAMKDPQGVDQHLVLPQTGVSHDELLRQMQNLVSKDESRWASGQVSGCVYYGNERHTEFLNTVAGLFALSNPLHPDVFSSTRKFEAEVVRMTLDLMQADAATACGCMTSGGTDSILMAIKTYRDWARAVKGITRPQLVVPRTAHAAFAKACQYFCIELKVVEVDPKTFRVVPEDMERAITSHTIAIVGSAMQYPHGVIDPIKALGEIAKKYNVGLHVDACLGGFILPFARTLGYLDLEKEAFDFSVAGVTSMSADTHKYGYATKGTSVVLYASRELRRYQYFCIATWPGGTYVSPSMSGSRAGSLIAACWASLVSMGRDGYEELARGIIETARAIVAGLGRIENVRVLGEPSTSVFAFTWETSGTSASQRKTDVYRLGSALSRRGWNLTSLQSPPGLHFSLTAKHIGIEERFLRDVAECASALQQDLTLHAGGTAAIYGVSMSLPESLSTLAITDLAFDYQDAVLDYVEGADE